MFEVFQVGLILCVNITMLKWQSLNDGFLFVMAGILFIIFGWSYFLFAIARITVEFGAHQIIRSL